MKKTYIQPSIEVHRIETANMIAGSTPQVGINRNGSVEAGSVESRGFFDWDDDEE